MIENVELIERYADLVERLDMLTKNQAELKEKLVPDEVRKAIEELNAEYNPMIETVQTELAKVEAAIVTQVLEYAKANPEFLPCQRGG